ncbi:hypothetical protein P7K49_030123 [Saguinus oedipus]|uniref:Phosphoglycerate mutase n=1 Tax=Saguinus oedipus TaxID=9490 RepID=A0ABQ9U1B9_SAGOE|nr:hypothetical protein P7K49_030123 [Saguinus oedipus]
MAAYKVVLIRHGESPWNLENRFSGWQALRDAGYEFDICLTSVQKRAIQTLWTVLDAMDKIGLPAVRTWRLTERHYFLQSMARPRSRSGGTPVMSHHLQWSVIILSTATSVRIAGVQTSQKISHPPIQEGKRALIAAHGDSIRGTAKHLEGLSEEPIMQLNMLTAIPIAYELDKNLKPIKSVQFLGDEETVCKTMEAVTAQGKAKK